MAIEHLQGRAVQVDDTDADDLAGWLGAYLLGFLTTMAIAGGGARRRPSAPARPRLG